MTAKGGGYMASIDLKERIARKRALIEKSQAELKQLIEQEARRERQEIRDRRLSCAETIEATSGCLLDSEAAEILGQLLALIREDGPAAGALRAEASRRRESIASASGEISSEETLGEEH